MTDIFNFYSVLPKSKQPMMKGYKEHLIEPNSRILMIGGSGTGKSNAILNFIEKSSGTFSKIIICSFSTTDEPLYQYLHTKMPEVELINNIDEVPPVQDYDDKNKNKQKLIVFDDFVNLNKKQMAILNDYAISSRKFGFTCIYVSQSYTSVPKIISRNCNYIMIFKINDKVSIKRIIGNHGLTDKFKPEHIERMYHYSTSLPLGFLTIDLKTLDDNKRLRSGFIDFF